MNKKNIHRKAMIMLLLVTIIWGSGFIATEYAIASKIDFSWIMALRFAIGALVIAISFFREVKSSEKKEILHGFVAGLILFAAFYTQTLGQSQTTVSNAAFITASNVIMVPLIVWAVSKKRPKAKVFFFCGLTMLGVVLLSVQFDKGLRFGLGDLWVFLCAFLFALHIAYLGLFCKKDHPIRVAFWQLFFAALTGLFILFFLRPQSTAEQWQAAMPPILYLGLLSTGLCYLLQTYAQKYVPPAQAGVILSMEGLFGTLFSLLLGLEVFRWNILAGGALISFSVIAMEMGNE